MTTHLNSKILDFFVMFVLVFKYLSVSLGVFWHLDCTSMCKIKAYILASLSLVFVIGSVCCGFSFVSSVANSNFSKIILFIYFFIIFIMLEHDACCQLSLQTNLKWFCATHQLCKPTPPPHPLHSAALYCGSTFVPQTGLFQLLYPDCFLYLCTVHPFCASASVCCTSDWSFHR